MVESPTDVMAAYYTHLDEGRFEAVADQFTDDVVFLSAGTIEDHGGLVGQDELMAYFRDERGQRDYDHRPVFRVDGSERGAVFGQIVDDGEVTRVFTSVAKLRGDRISDYAVFAAETAPGMAEPF